MKILTSSQIRQADAFTIANEPVASIDLMERACRAFVAAFEKHHQPQQPVWIFCGTGNNGGDGLGIARLLLNKGFRVTVFVEGDEAKGSEDFLINLGRLRTMTEVQRARKAYDMENPSPLVVVDALFGSGLSRPLSGAYADLVMHLNRLDAERVAVDIPSGLFSDSPQGNSVAFEAHRTITFQVPKLCFMMPENYRYVGRWQVADIQLSKGFLDSVETNYHLQEAGDKELQLPARPLFAHKGDAGRVLLLSGSRGKIGAAILASKACMRAGAGLLTVHLPGCGATALHTAVPEAMIDHDDHQDHITNPCSTTLAAFDTVAAGPGIGTHPATASALKMVFEQFRRPMVIDADALNIISQEPGLLDSVPPGSVLTPHPGEFRRLAGSWTDDYDRLNRQISFSTKYGVVVVLKGAYSSITLPNGQVYFNSTGNPGMATAGSGDVLTGIVAALLAQGFSPQKSARLAVLVHGISGDLAKDTYGEYALNASDIIEFLPDALKNMQNFND